MGDDIHFRSAGIRADGLPEVSQLGHVGAVGGAALEREGETLRALPVIGECPELLPGVPRLQEALLHAPGRFIPISGIAGIAVDNNDGMMSPASRLGSAASSPEAGSTFRVLQARYFGWKQD